MFSGFSLTDENLVVSNENSSGHSEHVYHPAFRLGYNDHMGPERKIQYPNRFPGNRASISIELSDEPSYRPGLGHGAKKASGTSNARVKFEAPGNIAVDTKGTILQDSPMG